MYHRTIIEFGFRIISWIIKTLCLCYLPQPWASADNTDLGFDNSWYHVQPHPIIVYCNANEQRWPWKGLLARTLYVFKSAWKRKMEQWCCHKYKIYVVQRKKNRDIHMAYLSTIKNIKQTTKELTATSDLATFLISMIAPVKISVNHFRTVVSMYALNSTAPAPNYFSLRSLWYIFQLFSAANLSLHYISMAGYSFAGLNLLFSR